MAGKSKGTDENREGGNFEGKKTPASDSTHF